MSENVQTVEQKEEVTENEKETLPEAKEEIVIEKEDTSRKLEIENAELRGKLNGIQIAYQNVSRENKNEQEIWKTTALNDINTLSDEEFTQKYKYSKLQVNSSILQYEFSQQTEQQSNKLAKIEAENKLLSKYSDFSEYSEAIREAINDAAPEVRKDPERLSKVMERAYLASVKSNPQKKATVKENSVERKSIQNSFEKPIPKGQGSEKKIETDEIPEEFRAGCAKFGLKSEKERQALMSSDDVETHFGDGIVFRDRTKGFEKVA